MPKAVGQRYKVMSGEHEIFVTEISFYAAAILAIKMFDLRATPKKLGPFVMVIANDGEYEVVETQFVLNDLGLKYKRIHEGGDNGKNSNSKCDKPERRNLTIFPPTQK